MKIKRQLVGERQDEVGVQELGEECILKPKVAILPEGSDDDLAKMAFIDPS